jgi:hypothetical protein
LFVEDHLATIEDLDAVKAYDLPRAAIRRVRMDDT